MEEVPFGGHFPTDTQLRVIGKLFVAPVSQGQSPPAVLVVHDQYRRFLHVDHLFGDGEFFPDERMGSRVLFFYQVQLAVQLVISPASSRLFSQTEPEAVTMSLALSSSLVYRMANTHNAG